MSWRDLLAKVELRVLPWFGGRELADDAGRRWTVDGPLPDEHGWVEFELGTSRKARMVGPGDAPAGWDDGRPRRRGWLVGTQLCPDDASVPTDPEQFFAHTTPVALVPRGLPRFARVAAAQVGKAWVFAVEEFPLGPEDAVTSAFTEGPPDLSAVPGVPPGLELAFRFAVDQRDHAERRAAAAREARRVAAEDIARMVRRRRGEGRLADALAVSGATLVDHRPSWEHGETVVTFRFRGLRFECVVDDDLRIVDAGICLNDYASGVKGDTLFTLESLPAVIDEAIRTHRLVIFRHGGGDDE